MGGRVEVRTRAGVRAGADGTSMRVAGRLGGLWAMHANDVGSAPSRARTPAAGPYTERHVMSPGDSFKVQGNDAMGKRRRCVSARCKPQNPCDGGGARQGTPMEGRTLPNGIK